MPRPSINNDGELDGSGGTRYQPQPPHRPLPDGAHATDAEHRIALGVVELLLPRLTAALAPTSTTAPGAPLVDARTLAGYLSVSRSWVYAHADELGAVRFGTGARPRLRFHVGTAIERATARLASDGSHGANLPVTTADAAGPGQPRRRRVPTTAGRVPLDAPLLPVGPARSRAT